MLEHVLNLGNQLTTDLETSEGFASVDYERILIVGMGGCLLYTSPSPRDGLLSRMPSSA